MNMYFNIPFMQCFISYSHAGIGHKLPPLADHTVHCLQTIYIRGLCFLLSQISLSGYLFVLHGGGCVYLKGNPNKIIGKKLERFWD